MSYKYQVSYESIFSTDNTDFNRVNQSNMFYLWQWFKT